MKLFSEINVGSYSGYSQLHKVAKASGWTVPERLKTGASSILKLASKSSSYTLLPIAFLLYFDVIYKYHLQYLVGTLSLILLLAFFYNLQNRLLYHPEMPPNSSLYVPSPTCVPWEIVNIRTEDNVDLSGYFIRKPSGGGSTAPTIIYFHGNAGNAGSPCILPLAVIGNANLLSVDYRGYGKSSGTPSEEGLYMDGRACIEYARSRNDIDPNKIVLFGHSMGGAVAIELAALSHDADYRVAALIVENTFTRLPDAANHIFRGILPGLSKLPLAFYTNKFLSIEKISSVCVPILFICGEKDEIVNPNMTRALLNASNNPHTVLMKVPTGSHNDTWCVSKHYHRFISAFLAKVFNENLSDVVVAENGPEMSSQSAAFDTEITLSWKCEVVAN